MTYRLLHPTSWDPASLRAILESEDVAIRSVSPGAPLTPDEHPTVLLLDPPSRNAWSLGVLATFTGAGASL
ncbi:MAG: hypothetical protein ACREL2_11195, partial [Gemmatimonadales bacterium]